MKKQFAKWLALALALVLCLCAVSCGAPKYYENTAIPNFEAVTGADLTQTLGKEYVMYVYTLDAAQREAKVTKYLNKLVSEGFTVIGESMTSEQSIAMIKDTDGVILTVASETTVTVMVCTAEVLTAVDSTAAAE